MVWLNLKFNFKIVIISIQKSFLLLILIQFLSGLFHSYSNSISNSFPFLLSISVKNSFPFLFLFPLMEISLGGTSTRGVGGVRPLWTHVDRGRGVENVIF